MQEVLPGQIVLRDRALIGDAPRLPFRYAMLMPPLVGVDVVRRCTDIVDERGFVRVDATYRTIAHPEVFAAGAAVSLESSTTTATPCGVPKTGHAAEAMGRIVAQNVARALDPTRGALVERPPSSIPAKAVIDSGRGGLIIGSSAREPSESLWVLGGPEAHWAKLAFEKWFLATRKHGHA